ncbi:MAG: LysR family transcriptional regulator [Spirochaetia bacterium]|nr:LysR family transcriptional regulator [Spirochaetia bacterium]
MELRVLRYFLESVRQKNISRAAQILNVTQPTMSRQLKDLEYEVGEKLFERSNYTIVLTPAGELFRKHAEDIVGMVDKALLDIKAVKEEECQGTVAIGCAQSENIKYLARCMKAVQKSYPKITFDLYDGDTERVVEKLDKGLFDFAVIVENVDLTKYNCITVPAVDTWGVVMRADSMLARKRHIVLKDLLHLPIICSRQSLKSDQPKWFGDRMKELNVVATTDLSYNGSVLVKEGMGYLLTFKGLVDVSHRSGLCFRPLFPKLTSAMHIIWRKNQQFTPAAELLLNQMYAFKA